jgi:hypothetical protein
MKNCVEAFQIARLNIAKIAMKGRDLGDLADKSFVREVISVQTDWLVLGLTKHAYQDSAYIAMVACNQHALDVHEWLLEPASIRYQAGCVPNCVPLFSAKLFFFSILRYT